MVNILYEMGGLRYFLIIRMEGLGNIALNLGVLRPNSDGVGKISI